MSDSFGLLGAGRLAMEPSAPATRLERRRRREAFVRQRRRIVWAYRGMAVAAMLAVALATPYAGEQHPFFAGVRAPLEMADVPAATATAPVRLAGAVVRATLHPTLAPARPARARYARAAAGETVPVELTAYCLKGTTRRGRYVRQGIVAADPRVFPLARYIEVYVGESYLGRFLVDDTGGAIKGTRLDIWTPTCREALLFGRRKGTAVLVPRDADPAPTPDVTLLMPYVRRK